MASIVGAFLAFSLLIATQAVVWRLRRSAGHYTVLSALSLLVLIVSLLGFGFLPSTSSGPVRFLPLTGLEYWNFMMLYTALALSYMVTYSAIQADSPTMAILLHIEQTGSRGCSLEELPADLDNAILVVPRLDDLVIGKLVRLDRDRYTVTRRGSLLAKIYVSYRMLLKMEKGG